MEDLSSGGLLAEVMHTGKKDLLVMEWAEMEL